MADDNLANALDELKKVREFQQTYKSNSFEYDGTLGPLVRAIEYLVAEVEALRGEEGTVVGGGITVFDPDDKPWNG